MKIWPAQYHAEVSHNNSPNSGAVMQNGMFKAMPTFLTGKTTQCDKHIRSAKATGEPPLLLSLSVHSALRNAIIAARSGTACKFEKGNIGVCVCDAFVFYMKQVLALGSELGKLKLAISCGPFGRICLDSYLICFENVCLKYQRK